MKFGLQPEKNRNEKPERNGTGDRKRTALKPQSISPRDDVRRWRTSTARAPTRTLRSSVLRHFLPALAARTAWSGLRGLDKPGNQTNTSIRDTFDETGRECAANPRLQCRVPPA